jgi:homoserine dehydrogenase
VLKAIYVESDSVGPALYYGSGAGDMPTGNAVVGDIIDIAREIRNGSSRKISGLGMPEDSGVSVMKMEDVSTCYYLRLNVADKPGVLSRISGILGKHNISIRSMIQRGKTKKAASLVMMTHKAKEKDMIKALKEINRLSIVVEKTMFIRIEGEDG